MIGDDHHDFARAVVVLARKHNMTGITMTFHRGHQKYDPDDPIVQVDRHYRDQVRMQWSEGRHGSAEKIELRAETVDRISEQKDAPDAE